MTISDRRQDNEHACEYTFPDKKSFLRHTMHRKRFIYFSFGIRLALIYYWASLLSSFLLQSNLSYLFVLDSELRYLSRCFLRRESVDMNVRY